LEARHAVAVCTGSEVVFPDVPGLKEAKPWTSREVMSTSVLPEHLVIRTRKKDVVYRQVTYI
jgi:dihydrolipoamide dehydrogenase